MVALPALKSNKQKAEQTSAWGALHQTSLRFIAVLKRYTFLTYHTALVPPTGETGSVAGPMGDQCEGLCAEATLNFVHHEGESENMMRPQRDLNSRPLVYKTSALTPELWSLVHLLLSRPQQTAEATWETTTENFQVHREKKRGKNLFRSIIHMVALSAQSKRTQTTKLHWNLLHFDLNFYYHYIIIIIWPLSFKTSSLTADLRSPGTKRPHGGAICTEN